MGTAQEMCFNPGWPQATIEPWRTVEDAVATSCQRLACAGAFRARMASSAPPLRIRVVAEPAAWSGYTTADAVYLSPAAFNGADGIFSDHRAYLRRTTTHEFAHWLDAVADAGLSRSMAARVGSSLDDGDMTQPFVPGNPDGLPFATTKNGRLGPEEDFADSVTAWVWGNDYEPDCLGVVDAARVAAIGALVGEAAFASALGWTRA